MIIYQIKESEQPEKENRKSIQELFEGYQGDYQPEEIGWGEPEGNEIW